MVARSSLCLLLIPPASRSYEDCTLFQASIILKCGIASFLVRAYLPPSFISNSDLVICVCLDGFLVVRNSRTAPLETCEIIPPK